MGRSEPDGLGVVQVPLRQLKLVEGVGERLHDTQQAERLQTLFENTSADHKNSRHWIDGYIDNADVPSFLNKLGLSRQELKQRNIDQDYPDLDDQLVYFTQGRHRIEAATNIDPNERWTVRVSSMSLSQMQTNQTVKLRTEQYQHETRDSDGRIYSKLREYEGRNPDFHEWQQRLSQPKRYIFQRIIRCSDLAEALDLLMQFPGVVDSLHLGCYSLVFDNRIFEETVAGWNIIHAEWSKFTLGSKRLQSSVDKETVRALQGRAPAACEADRQWIQQAFASGQVWSRISDARERCELERRVQSTVGIIPSLKWLQGNLLYLNIAAGIIWKLIVPEDGRKGKRRNLSLQQILRSYWIASVSRPCVEVQEGIFQPVYGWPSFNLAYSQLMLAALRQFPYLSKYEPNGKTQEKLTLRLDMNCVSLFHKRAWLLGFRTSKIDHGIGPVPSPVQPQAWMMTSEESTSSDEARVFSKIDHRWGKPQMSLFRVVQKSAFLPMLDRATSHPEVDVIYVLQDLLRTFFQPCNFQYDFSLQCISLNAETQVHHNSSDTAGFLTRRTCNAGMQTRQDTTQFSIDNPADLGVSAFAEADLLGRVAAMRADVSMADVSKYDSVVTSPEEPPDRDWMSQSWLGNSTCSRSTLPSLAMTVQESDVAGRPADQDNPTSFASSLHSRSSMPTLPSPSSSRPSLDKGGDRSCERKAGHWQFRPLRPLMPATNSPQQPFPRASSKQPKPLAAGRSEGQDRDQNEYICNPWQCSPTSSRSTVPIFRPRKNSESGSVRTPQPLSFATVSTASRSVMPPPLLPRRVEARCMDAQKMEHLHEFLRTLPRGAGDRPADGWQGFDDSDDIESISI